MGNREVNCGTIQYGIFSAIKHLAKFMNEENDSDKIGYGTP
jgi:hypothetical protein